MHRHPQAVDLTVGTLLRRGDAQVQHVACGLARRPRQAEGGGVALVVALQVGLEEVADVGDVTLALERPVDAAATSLVERLCGQRRFHHRHVTSPGIALEAQRQFHLADPQLAGIATEQGLGLQAQGHVAPGLGLEVEGRAEVVHVLATQGQADLLATPGVVVLHLGTGIAFTRERGGVVLQVAAQAQLGAAGERDLRRPGGELGLAVVGAGARMHGEKGEGEAGEDVLHAFTSRVEACAAGRHPYGGRDGAGMRGRIRPPAASGGRGPDHPRRR